MALSQPSEVEPEVAVTRFIEDQRGLWGLSQEDAAAVEVVAVSRKGLPSVRLIQRMDGVEVFNSDVTVGIDQRNAVLSVSGQLFPGVARSPARSARQGGITEEAAIAKAASDLSGHSYRADEFDRLSAPSNSGPYRFYEHKPAADDLRPHFERPVRVKDVLFPVGGEQFVRGYYMELWLKDWPAFSYVIDTVDEPDVLFRKSLTSSIAFRYRVHNTGDALFRPEDGPAPGSPHPTGHPDGFQAPTIEEKLIEIESLLPGDPWLPPGATETRGNNCFAYADLRAPDGIGQGDVVGSTTEPGVFGHRYDHTKPASDPQNLQNSIVGMFFHVNWLHDRWYEAGFDEASGCAQQDNFGRGGLGGDPILAEGNDFSGKDNARMITPAEGSSPKMQMFEFNGTNPTRTSNHEALITFHEMGHYITNRLVGNAAGLFNQQGGAMGEGWGDFFAICMTSQAGDDFANGAFAVGGWTDETATFNDNYYFSIRRYPYSADMAAKNPLSFRHISASALLPVGPPKESFERREQRRGAQRRRGLVLRLMGSVCQPGREARAHRGRRPHAQVCGRGPEAHPHFADVHPGPRCHHHGGVRPARGGSRRGMGRFRQTRHGGRRGLAADGVDQPHGGGRELRDACGSPGCVDWQFSGPSRVPGHLRT